MTNLSGTNLNNGLAVGPKGEGMDSPSSYPAYPEYKDSGAEWLGHIPMTWTMTKVKYEAPFQVGWTPSTKKDANFIGCNLWANISDLKRKIITCTAKNISDKAAEQASMDITPKGSLLYSFKLSVGTISFAGIDLYTNEAIASFLPQNKNDLNYLYYAFGEYIIKNASENIYGAKILNQDLIKGAVICLPSRETQTKIAAFLDKETAKIDTLIEKQEKLIKLLQEKRQAVISHAVTKGLNPDVKMKDSGVEWLGEVPEHWVVAGFKKYLNKIIDYRGKTPNKIDSGVFLVTARNIKNGKINYELSQEFISEDDYETVMSRGKPKIGDVLFTTEAPLGEVACVDREDIALAQRIIKFDGKAGIVNNSYLKYLIQSDHFQQGLMTYATGSTALGIKAERLVYLRMLIPTIQEQVEIVKYIENLIIKTDALISKSSIAIKLSKERRTALISAAVTGKIDVRQAV